MLANGFSQTPYAEALRKLTNQYSIVCGTFLIAILAWQFFFFIPGVYAQNKSKDCREWDAIVREEGLYEYSLDAEWTTTDEDGNLVEVRRYVHNETGEWREIRRSVGRDCRGDTDYQFGENECTSITSSRSWTEEYSTDTDNADNGSFETQDPETGETLIVDWQVVERYQDYVVIEFHVRNTAISCRHQMGGRARYSFVGFQGFPPGTRILALDTNHSNANSPYLCVTDASGNCWIQSRKPSGEWVGNFWSPGRVTFAISGFGTITGFFGNGFTYYLVNNGNGVIVREADFSNPQQARELGLAPYAGPPVSLGGPPASSNSAPQCSGGTLHVVAPGDTLLRIAQRYGTSMDTIASINNLVNRNRINVGQQLTIACGQNAPPQQAPPAEGSANAPANPPPVTGGGTCEQEVVHVVSAGENLFRIALRYGTTVGAIASANSISDPTRIGTGQQLRIPCSAG